MYHVFRRLRKLLHFIKNNIQLSQFLLFFVHALPRGVSVIQGRPGFLGIRYTGALGVYGLANFFGYTGIPLPPWPTLVISNIELRATEEVIRRN